jgi:hypothetical protein
VVKEMEFTYENAVRWFDSYFEACNKNQGAIETVVNLKKFFTDDFEFWMYTAPPFISLPLSREGLLMTFVHPGLHEELSPNYYVIDVKALIVVVQFELQFIDEASGKAWPRLQASAHYHLVLDENEDLKIRTIKYWTQASPVDLQDMFDFWNACKEKALVGLAESYFEASV